MFQSYNQKSDYPILKELPPKEISQYTNIIFLILDGLGYDTVQKLPKNTLLHKNLQISLTTIYPPTTLAALTSFLTGKSPKEHGLIAWHLYLKEAKTICTILPYRTRDKHPLLLDPKKLKAPKAPLLQLNNSYWIIPERYLNGPYNNMFSSSKQQQGYANLDGMFDHIETVIKKDQQKKYLHVYWSKIDEISHKFGKDHNILKLHIEDLQNYLNKLIKKLKGTNTLLIITADHGHMITTKKKTILINNHPLLEQCLSQPIWGEPRTVMCQVYPHKRQQFEQYVKHTLQKYCTVHTSKELIDLNLFGQGKAHPNLKSRMGDYVLLAKDNYIFKQFLPNEDQHVDIGHHGGISKEELTVPLIKINIK